MHTESVAVTVSPVSERTTEELVDELVSLDRELRALDVKELLARQDALRAELKARVHDKVDAPITVFGHTGEVILTAPSVEAVVTKKAALKKLMGVKMYDKLAKFSLKDLRQHLNDVEIDSVTEKYVGPRRVKEVIFYEHTTH